MKSKLSRLFSMLLIVSFSPVVWLGGGLKGSYSQAPSDSNPEDEQVFVLTLADLGFSNAIKLQGPYQEVGMVFTLPADWTVKSIVQMNFQVESELQSLMQAFVTSDENENPDNAKGGILAFHLNGILVGEADIGASGKITQNIEVEPGLLKTNAAENELVISWDAVAACQYGVTSVVQIDSASRISIPYGLQRMDTQLRDLPQPFYSASDIHPYPVALVLPENPDESDLSALLAVSAGLGKLSAGKMTYEIFTEEQISQTTLEEAQLVFIGDMDDLQRLLNRTGAQFDELAWPAQAGVDDGVLLLQASPWNAGRALLLVSGASPAAIQKASAALASNDFLPYSDGKSAVITQLADTLSDSQLVIDQELGTILPDGDFLVEKMGDTTFTIPFNIPGDVEISPEAYIEIYFRHSQLIDYLQSSLTIAINGTKIGSIRFSDQSAENGLARIILPPDIIRPLKNTLEITYSVVPQDLCTDERSGNFWVSVLGDSYLHLPPTLEEGVGQAGDLLLSDFPEALLMDDSLSTLTFAAGSDDWQSWQYASELAFNLGTFTDANLLRPSARFVDSDVSDVASGNVVLIGKATDLPLAVQWNQQLPLPFEQDGSMASIPLNGIQFRMEAGQPLGVLQITRLEKTGTVLYCVAGDSDAGLRAAAVAAEDSILNKPGIPANITFIDKENNSHYFQVEKKTAAGDTESGSQPKWYERILGQNMEKANFFLLAGSLLVTLIFIAWIVWPNARK